MDPAELDLGRFPVAARVLAGRAATATTGVATTVAGPPPFKMGGGLSTMGGMESRRGRGGRGPCRLVAGERARLLWDEGGAARIWGTWGAGTLTPEL